MNKKHLPYIALAVLLAGMAALMIGPMREETATVDETTFMGGGYAYFKTGSAKMGEANPLLSQIIAGFPMLFCQVNVSPEAQALMEMRALSPVAYRWQGPMEVLPRLFPSGIDWSSWRVVQGGYLGQLAMKTELSPDERQLLWYHFGLAEAQEFGRVLVYDPQTDAEQTLFWARFTRLVFTLGCCVFVWYWTRELTGNPWAGVLGAALWGLNPLALAYGHLAITEPGIALAFPVAAWWMSKTLRAPSFKNFFVLGVLVAVALQMKFLAVVLGPVFLVLLAVRWRQVPAAFAPKKMPQYFGLAAAGMWLTLLAVYFPHWSPPPAIDFAQAEILGVPGWFQSLRPLLIPGEFFKAITTYLQFSQRGQGGFLFGIWSSTGWWYYYPVALCLKTPIPLLGMTAIGASLLLSRIRSTNFSSLVPWLVAAIYLTLSCLSKVNIGVRHALPIFPLLAVGIADQVFQSKRPWRIAGWVLCGWLAAVALMAYPYFIPYTNEIAGGTANGYKALIDSNYDWGQDGKQLKQWMTDNSVEHVYLDFFGTQPAIEWHKIPNQRVNAETAKAIRTGYLVVSASQLMHPEWAWLRESRPPTTRIGYTLFVYRF